MRKQILALLLVASMVMAQAPAPSPTPGIHTPLTNAVLRTDMDADSHRVQNLDVTNLPLQPLNGSLTSISANGVTATGLAVLGQPDLTALRTYVGATGTVVNTLTPSAGLFVNGFDSGTGILSRAAVSYSTVTGTPAPTLNTPPIASNFITGYTSATGVFTQAQPAFTNISGIATNAQLPATISGRTIDDTNVITVKDGSLVLENTAAPTKKLVFDLSAITAGNTRTITAPNTNAVFVVPISAVSHQFITSLGATGQFTQGQPDFTDLTGIATAAQVPNLSSITAPTGSVNLSGQKLINIGAATASGDATSKTYVDTAVSSGVPPPHQAVVVATTANVALTGEQTIDGVLTSASRVLVKDQSTASQNGIYTTAAGAWSRTTDADLGAEVPGLIFVSGGTLNGFTGWAATTPLPITIGVTSLAYTQTSAVPQYTSGAGLELAGTQFSVKGTASRIVVGAGGVDIDSGYIGQSSINTVGSITTGIWSAGVISGAYGGTGVNNTGKTLTLGGNLTTTGVTTLSGSNNGDVTLTGQNYISISGQQITANAIDLSGANVTGTLAAARMPALTGDITTSAGATATSLATNSVTNAKLAQMPSGTFKANKTVATANASDITPTDAKVLMSINNVENTALSTWAGSSNITNVGSVISGTWNATAVAVAKGGTGASTASGARANLLPITGNAGKALMVNAGGTDAVATPQYRKAKLVIITTTGTYTPTTGTTEFLAEAVGGGGGGAGAQASALNSAAGAGGGGGSYSKVWVTAPLASYSVTIGDGGIGGDPANGAGGNGTDTLLGSILKAIHGTGGSCTGGGTAIANNGVGGNSFTAGSIGDMFIAGSTGSHSWRLSGTVGIAGYGGSSPLGGGSSGAPTLESVGNVGQGYGSGGSGALSLSTLSRGGGPGKPGAIVITEYITTTAP